MRTVANMRALDQDVVQQIHSFRKMEVARGRNGWRHIYFASELKDEGLLDWLANGQLPENIDTVPDDDESPAG